MDSFQFLAEFSQGFSLWFCDFKCFNKFDLEKHGEKNHTAMCDKDEIINVTVPTNFECNSCNLTCKTEEKLENLERLQAQRI